MSRARASADILTTLSSDYLSISQQSPLLEVSDFYSGSKAVGWYTIASNPGNRASAKFVLTDYTSGLHQSIIFYATHFYSNGNSVNVRINNPYSGGGPWRYLRILDGGTYDGALLQIYADNASSGCNLYMYENIQSSGWTLHNFLPNGTDPGGLGNYSALTVENALTDLNTI